MKISVSGPCPLRTGRFLELASPVWGLGGFTSTPEPLRALLEVHLCLGAELLTGRSVKHGCAAAGGWDLCMGPSARVSEHGDSGFGEWW